MKISIWLTSILFTEDESFFPLILWAEIIRTKKQKNTSTFANIYYSIKSLQQRVGYLVAGIKAASQLGIQKAVV